MKQRSTRQRRLVLKTANTLRDHPSADQIYLAARGEDARISRGTVYRNLNLLVENGELRHVRIPGLDRFDWRVEPHDHLMCTKCGGVTDAPIDYDAARDDALRARGYAVSGHMTVFEWTCPACRADGDS
ncbi:MAG: Fur family transcriptional regulator [Christensenellales bacterium]|jgi:Fur family ferric uptake transcriptional regulator